LPCAEGVDLPDRALEAVPHHLELDAMRGVERRRIERLQRGELALVERFRARAVRFVRHDQPVRMPVHAGANGEVGKLLPHFFEDRRRMRLEALVGGLRGGWGHAACSQRQREDKPGSHSHGRHGTAIDFSPWR
jgi:hypothetical protein